MVIDGWLEVTPDSGSAGDTQIKVKALSPNAGLSQRHAVVRASVVNLPTVYSDLHVYQAASELVHTTFTDISGLQLIYTDSVGTGQPVELEIQLINANGGITMPSVSFPEVSGTSTVNASSTEEGNGIKNASGNINYIQFKLLQYPDSGIIRINLENVVLNYASTSGDIAIDGFDWDDYASGNHVKSVPILGPISAGTNECIGMGISGRVIVQRHNITE